MHFFTICSIIFVEGIELLDTPFLILFLVFLSKPPNVITFFNPPLSRSSKGGNIPQRPHEVREGNYKIFVVNYLLCDRIIRTLLRP